jgi:ribonucleoside-diphosphate reductase alpha chain
VDRKTYTFDEAYAASLAYFGGDELAAKVWVNKYALKDAFGNIYEKSPEDMHHRLATEIARIEKKYQNPLSEKDLFKLFDRFRYIVPQGSPMTGIGNDFQIASLSNCFVIGLDGTQIRMVR